ncbi:DUF3261 domain-containing protein [Undibacterium sp. TJN25]|uniref:DUF3261 domain-containing protein n=1 Tax=Undibacterium sp. TJN25 TaxID=3413056 RepID=UPI003BF1C970
MPLLQLSPASLGDSFSLVQRLSFSRLDGAPAGAQSLDALLEADSDAVSLAGFALGQRILSMRWDGNAMQAQRHPRLPPEADPARILSDVQLVYWPAAAIRPALSEGWSLDETPDSRSLSHSGKLVVMVSYRTTPDRTGIVILENRVDGYRLQIESKLQSAGTVP